MTDRDATIEGTRFALGTFAPVAVARRSGFDESLHVGAGVVLDADGSTLAEVGDGDVVVYPRSSLKPMQASAMLANGAVLDTDQLAIACASHSGAAMHLHAAESTLASVGLGPSALQNTPDRPYGTAERRGAIEAGVDPSPLQQNCSGKHAAMLATCRANGWPIEDYLAPDHPLQVAITDHIADLAGETVAHVGVDGCGAPTHAISLRGLARAFGRLAADTPVSRAMTARPELVGGDGRDATLWMTAVDGLIAKEGAAGVMAAALADGRSLAFKIADGSDDARRAVVPVAMELLGVEPALVERVRERTAVEILGHGRPVGELVGLAWPRRG